MERELSRDFWVEPGDGGQMQAVGDAIGHPPPLWLPRQRQKLPHVHPAPLPAAGRFEIEPQAGEFLTIRTRPQEDGILPGVRPGSRLREARFRRLLADDFPGGRHVELGDGQEVWEAGIGCRERRGTRRGPARGRRQHQSPPGDPACPRAGSRSLALFGTRRMRAGNVSVTKHECETVECSEQMPADQLHGFWKEMSDRGRMLQRAERARLDPQSRAVLAYVERCPDALGSVEMLEPTAIQELDDLIATYDADRPATAA